MNVRRGDVILAEYPHSLTGSSLRPVLVVQADDYNRRLTNLVVAQITRTVKRAVDPAHLLLDISAPDGRQTGLLHDSVVSCYNLNTINEQRVRRIIGRLPQTMMQLVDACLKAALGLQ